MQVTACGGHYESEDGELSHSLHAEDMAHLCLVNPDEFVCQALVFAASALLLFTGFKLTRPVSKKGPSSYSGPLQNSTQTSSTIA